VRVLGVATEDERGVDLPRRQLLDGAWVMVFRRTVLVLVVAVAACGVIGVASAVAGGGNSANAKLCQKSGWQSAQTDTGGLFANAEDCTSYAANGGTLFSPALSPSFLNCFGVAFDGQIIYYAFYAFNLSGFHPNSVVIFRLPGSLYPIPGFTVTTDANGSAVSPGAVVYDPASLAGLEATDAQGVHASVEFTAASC
jgi:hypothetical protein